jgi:hypothetical protein
MMSGAGSLPAVGNTPGAEKQWVKVKFTTGSRLAR